MKKKQPNKRDIYGEIHYFIFRKIVYLYDRSNTQHVTGCVKDPRDKNEKGLNVKTATELIDVF